MFPPARATGDHSHTGGQAEGRNQSHTGGQIQGHSQSQGRRFYLALVAIGLLALIVRGVQLSQRTFYWDDFIIPATFRGGSIGDYFSGYDGHLMPASALTQVLAARFAPLNWVIPAVVLMLLSAIVATLWARVCLHLAGHSLTTLGLYSALLFSPFLMDAAGWWSAGLNALAWQIGMAGFLLCFLATHPRLTSTPTGAPNPRSLRYSLLATAILLAALLFTEKALTIIPAAIALAILMGPAAPPPGTENESPWRDYRAWLTRFFAAPVVLFVAWSALFLTRSPLPAEAPEGQSLWSSVPKSLLTTVVPGAMGGPLAWDRWAPSSTFATAPTWWGIASAVLLLAAAVFWLRRDTRRRALGLLAIVGYLAIIYVLLVRARNSTGTSDLLLRSMHYFADWFTFAVLVVGCCVFSYRHRSPASPTGAPAASRARHTRLAGVCAIIGAVTISLISTFTWLGTWSEDKTADYLANLRTSMNLDGPGPTPELLEQPVPIDILNPVAHPYDRVSTLTGKPPVTQLNGTPRIIDESGNLVDAEVLASATSTAGTEPECGVRIAAGQSRAVILDNALPFGDWTWHLNATASTNMTLTITTPNGLEDAEQTQERATQAQVDSQLKPRWVRVSGGGTILMVHAEVSPEAKPTRSAEGAGEATDEYVCIGAGGIGPLVAKHN